MVCPECGRVLGKKDVCRGTFTFKCSCGWSDVNGDFSASASTAKNVEDVDDGEWLPDTGSVILH